MTSEPKITFFDFPSPVCKPKAWNPNTWKARLVLNYKQIPYKTVWLSYLDVEQTLIKAGGEGKATSTRHDDPSKPLYTLPALLDESGPQPVVVIDSLKIAEYLDEKFPERPVIPKKGRAFEHMFEEFFVATVVPFPLIPFTYEIQEEKSQPYFKSTIEARFGKIEDLSPEGPVRDAHWKDLENGFDKVAAVLDKNGPDVDFVAGGSEPTRADFILTAWLLCMRSVAPQEWKKRGVDQWANGRWAKLLKRTEEWQTVHE
ncbi:hypothetical protein M422DRAFT_257205 [Sphaerobolus stellatus SS14]|uniref:GST N-terminal domain-containing protein n=1 Tax=Sphaerobolus stellatus (strain SS14) TaxID=990650 RepID=A0A0C9UYE4_SPHS4|nr:hypothetical protein M422DRAFT_257205 [Sphaerobolus stellatus SS14]